MTEPKAEPLTEDQAFSDFWKSHTPFTKPVVAGDGEEWNSAVDDCLYAHQHGWDARQPKIDALRAERDTAENANKMLVAASQYLADQHNATFRKMTSLAAALHVDSIEEIGQLFATLRSGQDTERKRADDAEMARDAIGRQKQTLITMLNDAEDKIATLRRQLEAANQ